MVVKRLIMAANKAREKSETSTYRLDATELHAVPMTMTEILTKGTPREVREFLCGQGSLLRAGAPLPKPVAEWLGAALEAIGRGEDANRALRVKKSAPGPQPIGIHERAMIEHQIAGLVEQGKSHRDAMGIVQRYRMARRHSDDPDGLWGQAEEDHDSASQRLKKLLHRKRQGTK